MYYVTLFVMMSCIHPPPTKKLHPFLNKRPLTCCPVKGCTAALQRKLSQHIKVYHTQFSPFQRTEMVEKSTIVFFKTSS